jgi:hypothetical protein
MGMGYGANYADVISWEEIKKLCPNECHAVEARVEELDTSLDGWMAILDERSANEPTDKDKELLNQLCMAFENATAVGESKLSLHPMYHSTEDEGDRYDDVSGGFFHVENLYQYSPAGEKIKAAVERKFFVTFG